MEVRREGKLSNVPTVDRILLICRRSYVVLLCTDYHSIEGADIVKTGKKVVNFDKIETTKKLHEIVLIQLSNIIAVRASRSLHFSGCRRLYIVLADEQGEKALG